MGKTRNYDVLIQEAEAAIKVEKTRELRYSGSLIAALVNALKESREEFRVLHEASSNLYEICVLSTEPSADKQTWDSDQAWDALAKVLGRSFEADINEDGDDG